MHTEHTTTGQYNYKVPTALRLTYPKQYNGTATFKDLANDNSFNDQTDL